MPGWPVRVFISLAGSCYHATPYCPLLKAGWAKAAERGHAPGQQNQPSPAYPG